LTNLLAWAHSIKTEGVVRSSTGDGGRPFIHSDDIAAVSVAAMLDEAYTGRVLSITGPKSLSFADATQIIGNAIRNTLLYQTISDQEAAERYSRFSGSPEETEAHVYQQPHVAELNGYLTCLLLYGNMAIWTSMYRVTT
jgi:uncharacterized protein YbjT (DUF2867 family)